MRYKIGQELKVLPDPYMKKQEHFKDYIGKVITICENRGGYGFEEMKAEGSDLWSDWVDNFVENTNYFSPNLKVDNWKEMIG